MILSTADDLQERYIGCSIDEEKRVLNTKINSKLRSGLSVDVTKTCIKACGKTYSTKYAGLQFGYQCFCGNVYDSSGRADEKDCNMKCHGNDNLKCGSIWRNSVYKTGSSLFLVVSDNFHKSLCLIGNCRYRV